MTNSNREIVSVTERCLITEKELDDAFHTCEEAFWAQVVELFPEARSGDTEPGATGHYQDVVKAFMKHWLSLNTNIDVGGLTEDQAITRLEDLVQLDVDPIMLDSERTVTGQGSTEIIYENHGQRVILTVVELSLNGTFQGHGIQARNPATGNTMVSKNEQEIEEFIELVETGKDVPST